MDGLKDGFLWLSGGARQYMPTIHCMKHDWFWVYLTIASSAGIMLGYALIALKWRTSEKLVSNDPVKRILRDLRNIFIWCAICGYGFNIIRMWWPAWRLLDFSLIVLSVYTFRYVFRSRGMRVVYEELSRVERLQNDVTKMSAEDDRRRFFMNAISHDLRSPLNSSVLNTDLAKMAIESGQRELALDAVALVKENAMAATDLLNKLLDYTRLSMNMEVCPSAARMSELAAGVARRHASAAHAKGVELLVTFSDASAVVNVDVSKTERIMSNLVDNAIKFTDQGKVAVKVGLDEDMLLICVTDSGRGIPAEHQSSLFNEFFQVGNYERDRLKGFGLGLAISRVLARQMGGDVVLARTSGQGSAFECRIPANCSGRRGEGAGGRGRLRGDAGHHVAVAS